MKKYLLVLIAVTMLYASPAFALFVNGGFEDGTLNGWTVENGYAPSGVVTTEQWGTYPTSQFYGAVTSAGPVASAYNGTYMAQIGDLAGGRRATRISQTDTLGATDVDAGSMLYVNWGAVLNNPSGHPTYDQPHFGIEITIAGASVGSFWADAETKQGGGWADVGGNNFYKSGTFGFDLTAYALGDSVTIALFAADCGYGAHGGYALLDGIGTTFIPPGNEVPEPATMLLFGLGLLGLAGTSRRKK